MQQVGNAGTAVLHGLGQSAMGLGQSIVQGGPPGQIARQFMPAGQFDPMGDASVAIGNYADANRRSFDNSPAYGGGVMGDSGAAQVGNFVGEQVLPVALTRKIPALGAKGKVAQAIEAAGRGLVYSQAGEARAGDRGGQRLAEGGAMAAISAPFPLAGQAVRAVMGPFGKSISEQAKYLYDAAKARGINLTPAQLTDSDFLKSAAALFGAGGKARYQQQVGQVNRAVAQDIGSHAPVVTKAVYAGIKDAQGALYDQIMSRNNLSVTPAVANNLYNIVGSLPNGTMSDAARGAVNDFYALMAPHGHGLIVPGKDYQALVHDLGLLSKTGTPEGHAVGRVRKAIMDAMDASMRPEDRAPWLKLNTEYGNRKTITNLVAKAGNGPLDPLDLLARTTKDNYGKESMASGTRGSLGPLADIGQVIRSPPSMPLRIHPGDSLLNPLNALVAGKNLLVGPTIGRLANSPALGAAMGGGRLNALANLSRTGLPSTIARATTSAILNKKDKKKSN